MPSDHLSRSQECHRADERESETCTEYLGLGPGKEVVRDDKQ